METVSKRLKMKDTYSYARTDGQQNKIIKFDCIYTYYMIYDKFVAGAVASVPNLLALDLTRNRIFLYNLSLFAVY